MGCCEQHQLTACALLTVLCAKQVAGCTVYMYTSGTQVVTGRLSTVHFNICCTACLPQFCDFNSDSSLVCEAINDLEAVEENYESFGESACYL